MQLQPCGQDVDGCTCSPAVIVSAVTGSMRIKSNRMVAGVRIYQDNGVGCAIDKDLISITGPEERSGYLIRSLPYTAIKVFPLRWLRFFTSFFKNR
jgi:hypothetical protein